MYEDNITEESKIDDLKEYSSDFLVKMATIKDRKRPERIQMKAKSLLKFRK